MCLTLIMSLTPQQTDFDLLLSLQACICHSLWTFKGRHTKGHQDNTSGATLDWWAIQNIWMDKLAKLYWLHLHCHPTEAIKKPPGPFPMEGWTFWLNDEKLSNFHQHTLYNCLCHNNCIQWWIDHGCLTPNGAGYLNWLLVGDIMHALNPTCHQWLVKQASNNCRVGVTLQKWGIQTNACCS
jgi:hypothetical protein